jgi:hypothetical protein
MNIQASGANLSDGNIHTRVQDNKSSIRVFSERGCFKHTDEKLFLHMCFIFTPGGVLVKVLSLCLKFHGMFLCAGQLRRSVVKYLTTLLLSFYFAI